MGEYDSCRNVDDDAKTAIRSILGAGAWLLRGTTTQALISTQGVAWVGGRHWIGVGIYLGWPAFVDYQIPLADLSTGQHTSDELSTSELKETAHTLLDRGIGPTLNWHAMVNCFHRRDNQYRESRGR